MRIAWATAALAWTVAAPACTGTIDGEGGQRQAAGEKGTPTSSGGRLPVPGAPGGAGGGGAAGSGATPGTLAGGAPPVFSCDRSLTPDELPLPRLSRTELENTLRFAIRLALPADSTAIWKTVSAAFAGYPADQRTPAPGDLKGGYSRADQSIQQTQVDAIYATGVAIAQELTASPTRIAAMMGPCATDASTANDRSCLEGFVARWGSRVMRYPLAQQDVAYFADIAGAFPVGAAGVADVITTVLNAPETLYRVEHGTDDTRGVAPLSAFEVAARLSYAFWLTPPDDELWAAATSGALLAPAGFQAQLQRLIDSPNVRSSLDEFMTEWLRLDELPPLDALKANAIFKAFAGAQMPPSGAREAMIGDVLASARAAFASGRSVSDFLNDRRSYAGDAFVAGVYQVAPWNGEGSAPLMASPSRAGLLTRAALLATGTATTRPIHKGYIIRNAVLCQQVPPPPANVDTTPPTSTKTLTTRQAVTALTSAGVCGGCHSTVINPPGFLTEGFDALGRERTHERLFDERGNVIATLPVEAAAAPVVSPGDTRELRDASELTKAIDASGLFHSCLARHYFRFTQRRPESAAKDGCLLSEMESAARSGAPIAEVLKTIGRSPAFKARRFQ